MSSRLSLRQLEPAFCDMRNALLRQPTRNVCLARPNGRMQYVALDAMLDGRPCNAYVEAQSLLDHWLGDATVPIDQLEQPVLRLFMEDSYRAQGMPTLVDGMSLHEPREILHGNHIDHLLFHVNARPMDVLVERLPQACCLARARAPSDLFVLLSWTLPGPTLRAAELAQLTAGDALRIPARPGTAWAGDVPITNFCLEGFHLMLLPPSNEPEIDEDHSAEERCSSDDLPVRTTFVLATQMLTVGTIAALRPGCTLPLPMTTPHVTLMSGSRVLGRGELVQIGETLAVELSEVRVVSDRSDAENPA